MVKFKALAFAAAGLLSTSAYADIINTVGLTQIAAPANVQADFLLGTGQQQVIFLERQNFTLLNNLVMDTGTIPAGTVVNSYFFAVNFNTVTIANTSVTFNVPILGITYKDGPDPYGSNAPFNPLFASSNFLGAAGTTYDFADCRFCGFEVAPSFDMDSASFGGNAAAFHNNYSNPGDFARIVTTVSPVTVPGPIVGAGLPALFGLLGGLLWWRRRR